MPCQKPQVVTEVACVEEALKSDDGAWDHQNRRPEVELLMRCSLTGQLTAS